MTASRHGHILIPLAATASLVALAGFAGIASAVFTGQAAHFDLSIRAAVHAQSTDALTQLARLFTFLGSTPFISTWTVVFSAALWRDGSREKAWRIIATVVGATLVMLAMKYGFNRPRPAPFFGEAVPPFNSFPSGHSLVSFCFYGVLASLSSGQKPWIRIAAWTAAGAMVLSVGLSRIYLGVHYPTDVFSAYLAATSWTLAVIVGRDKLLHAQPQKKGKKKK